MTYKKIFRKIILISSLFIIGGFFSLSQGQHISLENQNEILKMFCEYTRNINFDTDGFAEDPSGVIMYLNFDPNNLQILGSDFRFSSLFPNAGFDPEVQTGLHSSLSTLIAQREGLNNSLPSSGKVGELTFKSKRTTGASLIFRVDGRGTNDNTSDTDLIYGNNGADMLVYVSGANYSFITGLCQEDAVGPIITNFNPNITANTREVYYGDRTIRSPQYISAKISSSSGLSFIVKDGDSTNKTQAGYVSGEYPNLDLNDYRANTAGADIYRPLNVADRASGINPDSLHFSVSNISTDFTKNNVSIFSGMGKTRDRRTRDYYVQIAPNQLQDYGIEGNISFHAEGQEYSLKPLNFTHIFNPSIEPRITNMNPHPGETQVLPLSDIFLRVRDDWAGVDPDSIVVTVMQGTNTLGIFSGNDLQLTMTGGDADNPDFFVKINSGTYRSGNMLLYPIPFTPYTANTITIIVQVKDFKDNQIHNPYDRYNFDTRYSCNSYPGCKDPLWVDLYQYGEWKKEMFLYPDMYVTGSSPNILASGDNHLYCATGDINMRIGTELEGPGITNPQEYTGKQLYIDGARAVFSGNLLLLYPN